MQPLKGTGNPVTEPNGSSDKSGRPPAIYVLQIIYSSKNVFKIKLFIVKNSVLKTFSKSKTLY